MSKKRLSAIIASFAFLAVSTLSTYATSTDTNDWFPRCTVEQAFCDFERPAYCEAYGNFGARRGTGQGRRQRTGEQQLRGEQQGRSEQRSRGGQRFANESMRYQGQGQRQGQTQPRGLGAGQRLCW